MKEIDKSIEKLCLRADRGVGGAVLARPYATCAQRRLAHSCRILPISFRVTNVILLLRETRREVAG